MSNNYIKGCFIRQPHENILSIGIKKDEFIKSIEELEVNEKGYCNLTIKKKKEPGKFGDTHFLVENRYQFENRKPSNPESLPEDDDDLPF